VRKDGYLARRHAHLVARRGKTIAIVAVARKMTHIIWKMLTEQREYQIERGRKKLDRKRKTSGSARPRL
jgi:hypothetical protein